jgi:hypothetical protein
MKLEIKNKNENETVTGPDHKQTTVHVLSKGKKQGLKKKNKYKVTLKTNRTPVPSNQNTSAYHLVMTNTGSATHS